MAEAAAELFVKTAPTVAASHPVGAPTRQPRISLHDSPYVRRTCVTLGIVFHAGRPPLFHVKYGWPSKAIGHKPEREAVMQMGL